LLTAIKKGLPKTQKPEMKLTRADQMNEQIAIAKYL
jgi:hypothetical protein